MMGKGKRVKGKRKSKAKKKRYVNRLWEPKITAGRSSGQEGHDAKAFLELMPNGPDESYVMVGDQSTNSLIYFDKHGIKTAKFETCLIEYIKQNRVVTVLVGKNDIDACNVWVVEQTISTINNARCDEVIGAREGAVRILPHGLHYRHLTGFEHSCQLWCKKLAQEVPEWWYFLDREGGPHETTTYWMTINASEQRMPGQVVKLSVTEVVLDSVNSLPNSEEEEQIAVEWMRRLNLLTGLCHSKEGLETFKKMRAAGRRIVNIRG